MITKIIAMLIMIESGGDENAVGDNVQAIGCLQIHPIMVEEVNRILKINGMTKRYDLNDRLKVKESKDMCRVFLVQQQARHRNKIGRYPDFETLALSWQSGGIFNKPSENYRKKIKEQM